MSEKKVGKRLLTWVLVLVMTLSLLPLNVLAAEVDAAGDTNTDTKYSIEKSGANLVKSATKNDDGTYTIQLESWVTGTVEQTTGSAPLDIVLVLDQSGSMSGNKLQSLKTAVTNFVTAIDDNATKNSVEHRIAIVGFASNQTEGGSNYEDGAWYNTGIFVNGQLKNYQTYQGNGNWEDVYLTENDCPANGYEYRIRVGGDILGYHQDIKYNTEKHAWGYWYWSFGWQWKSITPKTDASDTNGDHVQVQCRTVAGYIDLTEQDYKAALVKSNDASITTAINNLAANGATRASYGMEMANKVFENNELREGSSRVVVFFTDGEPGQNSYETSEAGRAIAQAYTTKNHYDAKVFSVGMFAKKPSQDSVNFMNYVSSNYPDANASSDRGDWTINPGNKDDNGNYYMTASSVDLSTVFETISSSILTPSVAADGSTILTDTLSPYFAFGNATDEAGTVTGVTVQKQKYNGAGQPWGEPETVENVNVALNPTTKAVTVRGFDYSSAENVVTDGATPSGHKLVVTFNVKPDTSCTSWTAADRYVTNSGSATLGKDGSDPFATVASPEAPVETYQVKYTVSGEDPKSATYEDGKHYITGQTANVLARPNSPVGKDGYTYTFDGWKNGDITVNDTVAINDADVVLTGTWTKAATEYTITYDLEGGALAEGKTNRTTYTVETEDFTLHNPTKQGYTFAGWTGTDLTNATETVTVAKGNTGNRTYTATWTPNGNTGYNVEYYFQNINDNDFTLDESKTKPLTGETGTPVNAPEDTFEGFTLDTNNPNNVKSGTIAADGSLVLKLYYARNSYTVTYKYTNTPPSDATPALPTAETYKYGATVDVAAAPTSTTHNFSGWSTSDATIDSGKFTMPNKPVKLSGSWTANEVKPTLVDVTVNYYKDSVTTENLLATETLTGQAVKSQITLTSEQLDAKKPTTGGYMSGVQQGTVPYKVQEEDNIINVLYTKEIKPDTVLGVLNQYVKKQFNSTYGYPTTAEFIVDAVVTKNGSVIINASEGQIAAQELSPVSTTYTGKVTLSTGASELFVFSGTDTPLEASTHYQVTVKERDAKLSYVTCDTAEHTFNFATNANGEVNDIQGVTVTITNTYYYKPTYRPPTPTVVIPDDDALGLNTTDHFAYIVGYGNGEVRPQNNITRAEVATIFFRLLTDDVRDENLTKTNRYSDVASTAWYNTAVSTLSSMGIITGYPDGTFRPNAAITRAEFAAIAARFDHDGDKTAAKFSDIANHWAKDEISIAYNNGWITGYPDGTFGPQRDITRAETMTLVNRVLNRQPETEEDLLPNMTVWTDNANPKAWYYLAVQEATNSHYYKFKTNSKYEKWTELRETRDWTQLEK